MLVLDDLEGSFPIQTILWFYDSEAEFMYLFAKGWTSGSGTKCELRRKQGVGKQQDERGPGMYSGSKGVQKYSFLYEKLIVIILHYPALRQDNGAGALPAWRRYASFGT